MFFQLYSKILLLCTLRSHLCLSQVNVALAGLSVQQDHWKDNTSRKLENSYHSANRTSWTVQESSVILVVKEDSWIMLSSKGSFLSFTST